MSQEKQEGEFSLKGKKTKPKNLGKTQDGPIKVDLSKSDKEPEVTKVVINTEDDQVEEVVKKVVEEEIKQEQKAEKILELSAKQLKEKFEDFYNKVADKVFEKYPFYLKVVKHLQI